MSASYQPVLWNKFKKQYDALLWSAIIVYLLIFVLSTVIFFPTQNINTTLIRAFGTLAIILLHGILIIGPLSRFSNKLLPILYNRRHLGVTMFIIATAHVVLSIIQFHANGNTNPILSIFISNQHYDSFIYFPFQTLGFIAFIILAAMAFTSHDFWLHFLSPKFWKILHMLVYVAYGLIVLHVALGILQFEKSPILIVLLVVGFVLVCGLHLLAGFKENKLYKASINTFHKDWTYVCNIQDIEEDKAKMVNVQNEKVAIFKYNGKLSAVHNVCKHQMGPLGEGKVIDGCITCPWHGYQYRPEDGCAPAPFTEKIATYQLKLIDDKIYVNTQPQPEGTFIEPVNIVPNNPTSNKQGNSFFIGWANNNKQLFKLSRVIGLLSLLLIISLAFVLSCSQQKIATLQIDYNKVDKIEGWLRNKPVPSITIVDGKDVYGNPIFKNILLVNAFKFGADEIVEKVLNGDSIKYVKLKGYISTNIITCGNGDSSTLDDCMEQCSQCIVGTTNYPVMEIENGSFSFENAKAPIELVTNNNNETEQIITGEIIDPKCYFGAMNPGYGKPHLSCAVRCISGGIMPVIKFKVNSKIKYAVLLGQQGQAINSEILKYVGLPIKVKGLLADYNNWQIFKIDPLKNIQIIK